MANSLSDFAKRMEKRADKVEVLGNELAKVGVMAAVETLVWITPVDTSEHLSNWQVTLGGPASRALPPYVAGTRGSTQGISARDAISVAAKELEPKKAGQDVWISNMGPAIGYLDEGSSTQFAGGFVPRAMVVFRNAVAENVGPLLKI